MAPNNHINTTLQLNLPKRWGDLGDIEPTTPNAYFQKLFPAQYAQFGPAFLEMKETAANGFLKITPISLNIDFFASVLSDPSLGLSVVYFEPEMQFYYAVSGLQPVYKPVSPEKLMSFYRGLLIRAAQSFGNDVNILNLFVEFRSDKTAKAVVQRAKSVLACDADYFSATSCRSRIRGIELHERLALKFVGDLLTADSGQVVMLQDAYLAFCKLLKERELSPVKRSDFKAMVVPIVKQEFDVALRNDLVVDGKSGQRGWKNVRLQALPA